MIWGNLSFDLSANSQPPPVSGQDPEEEVDEPEINVPRNWTHTKLTRSTKDEYIDVDIIDAILIDNNGQELSWLKELLEGGVRIRNPETGRYLKPDRFLKLIKGSA